ncbi:MAG: response regulator [Bdellovibrionota bacterium]
MYPPETRFLVVDDAATMRMLVGKVLRQLGYTNIVECENGAVAWKLLEEGNPATDFVISDWNMPDATGLTLLKNVRSSDRHKDLPFLMVTSEASNEQVVEAIRAGVDNYIIKPFTGDSLKAKIDSIYKKRNGIK